MLCVVVTESQCPGTQNHMGKDSNIAMPKLCVTPVVPGSICKENANRMSLICGMMGRFPKVCSKVQYEVCYNAIVEWCERNLAPFLLLEWETSSHNIAILVLDLFRNRFHSVSSYLVVSSPGYHHFRGFYYMQRIDTSCR